MLVDNNEVSLLNFYRASELHGGLILGQMVRRTRDAELIMQLTRHSAEEVMHALLWTETIVAVGGKPSPVRDTYQNRYVEIVGTPITLLEGRARICTESVLAVWVTTGYRIAESSVTAAK